MPLIKDDARRDWLLFLLLMLAIGAGIFACITNDKVFFIFALGTGIFLLVLGILILGPRPDHSPVMKELIQKTLEFERKPDSQ